MTHTHFDHVGAVAPVARATGAPVYCPELETRGARRTSWTRAVARASGRSRATRPTTRSPAARRSSSPGSTIDVIFTPGHSPGHVTYAIPAQDALFSGDVLFQGSVGRVDLPGGDWPTLLRSIESLIDAYPAETTVYPGHMGITTLGASAPRTRSCASSPPAE